MNTLTSFSIQLHPQLTKLKLSPILTMAMGDEKLRKVVFLLLVPLSAYLNIFARATPTFNLDNQVPNNGFPIPTRSFHRMFHNELSESNVSSLALDLHNDIRKDHQSPPLKLCSQLQRDAQAHAEKIYASSLENNTNLPNQNIFYSVDNVYGSSETINIFFAIVNWYDVEYNYNYDNPIPVPDSFTRIVWKSTTKLGIGYVVDNDKKLAIVVANYGPSGVGPDFSSGNIEEYKANILKPIEPERNPKSLAVIESQ